MGDRVTVLVTVRLSDGDKAKEILQQTDGTPTEHYDSNGFDYLVFDEVNYGNLCGAKKLAEAGIPFDCDWEYGYEFNKGTLYSRYDSDGGLVQFEVYDTEINPDIEELIKLIDDHEKLKHYILMHKERTTPLAWETQEANSKLFRAMRLISPETVDV